MAQCSHNRLHAGEYSHGTLRDADIAEMFDDLAELADCDAMRDLVAELRTYLDENAAGLFVGVNIDDTFASLYDHADNHAPIGHWFGAHEGDASSFGYWTE